MGEVQPEQEVPKQLIFEGKEARSDVDKVLLPLLPLRGMLVFPYMVISLEVGREKSLSALDKAMDGERLILLVAQKQAKINEPDPKDIYEIGTLAEVKQLLKMADGTVRILVEGICRARIAEYTKDSPYYEVSAEKLEDRTLRNSEAEALMRNTMYEFEQYVKMSKKIPPEILVSVSKLEDPGRLADSIASQLNLKIEDKQEILESIDQCERLEKLCAILTKEMEILELERKIHIRVRKQMEKTQKEYYLREQIKAIQKELGEKDERTAEVEELKDKLKEVNPPEEITERVKKELDRLEKMPPMAAEAVVVRNYIDWILSLPWSVKTEDRIDIGIAEEILNADHYGLEKVKERIIEFLAVKKLADKMKGPILCLVGPPGVGKTSLAKSVARSMERKFVRFSLGGVRDEAEIRGHRRTYIGAMPGRIIQAMKQAGTKNPVILLDEIDKMSSDFRGDPASALLEVLDPEQNCNFGDHYIEAPFDLSDVLFITTANYIHSIPRPLLDRMEVISIPGYTEEEKLMIAKTHLVGKQMKDHGITDEQMSVEDDAIREVIQSYTRESGVRSLERSLSALCRKVAKKIVKGEEGPITLTKEKINEYLGSSLYRYGIAETENKVGVSTGLVWTEVGGDIIGIEVNVLKGKGALMLTGKLGEVMKESAQAAFSYVRSRAMELGIDEYFHEKFDIHIHVPEGATPKEGPSAGITMCTALVSALTGKEVRCDVAMTGEITLRGRVLPIGGLKEKVLAAHRAGIKTICIPWDNNKDLEEIPDNIRRSIEFVPVKNMDEVLNIALVGGMQLNPGFTAINAAGANVTGSNVGIPFHN